MFKALIVALAAVAVAIPTHPQHGGNTEVGDVCGNAAEVRCCNDEGAKHLVENGLNILNPNMNGQCQDMEIPIVGIVGDVSSNCKQQIVCCGHTDQSGLVNLGCIPISL